MNCKCAKCFKPVEEKDQVHYESGIYCEPCCKEKQQSGSWIIAGVLIFVVVLIVLTSWVCYKSTKE